MAFEIFLKPVIALPVILALCYFVYAYVTAKSNLPDLPWIGASDGQWFAKGRARIRNTFKYQAAIQCAYDNVSFALFRVHYRLFLTSNSLVLEEGSLVHRTKHRHRRNTPTCLVDGMDHQPARIVTKCPCISYGGAAIRLYFRRPSHRTAATPRTHRQDRLDETAGVTDHGHYGRVGIRL